MRHRQRSQHRASDGSTTSNGADRCSSDGTGPAPAMPSRSSMPPGRSWAAGHGSHRARPQTLLARLARHDDPAALPVAIERAEGLVVDRLIAAGHPVVPIDPNAFHAARPRWGAAGAKSDPGDSYKLADYLRTDGHRLRRLQPLDAATRELQALTGCATTTSRPGPRPATSSARCWMPTGPAPSRSSPGSPPRSPWPSWPTTRPRSGRPARRGPPGRVLPPTLLPRRPQPCRAAQAAPIGTQRHRSGWTRGARRARGAQVPAAATLLATIADLDRAMRRDWPPTPRPGCWPRSPASARSASPSSSPSSAPSWTAPAAPSTPPPSPAPPRSPERRARPAASASGWRPTAAPATPSHVFADNARHSSPWAAKLYADARGRGKRHPQAVRILGRAWLRVIWACWHTNTPYDPARHRAEQRHAAA